jgi:hypothetical protein
LDALFIKVEALIERLVDIAADCVASIGVGRLWVGHEIECVEQHLRPDGELRASTGKASLSRAALGLNLAQLCLDFGLWELVVGEQVE